MDDNAIAASEHATAPEPSATDRLIDAWHRDHFAGVPTELFNISQKAVADLKARLANT